MDISSRIMSAVQSGQHNNQWHTQWTVINGTFSGHFTKPMPNLNKLRAWENFRYDPRRLNAGIIKNELGTILLFQSGSFVIVGVRCEKIAKRLIGQLQRQLKQNDISAKLCHLNARNYVVWFNPSDQLISLLNYAFRGNDETRSVIKEAVDKVANITYSYEPETFPSVKFFIKNPSATVCIFRTKGTGIITGL